MQQTHDSPHVRRLRRDQRAASEIVGALFLILIVSTAATTLAVYVQKQQKKIGEQKLMETERGAEKLEVLSVLPTLDTSGSADRWLALNFSIVSGHAEESDILGARLNNLPADGGKVTRYNRTLDAWRETAWDGVAAIHVQPREHVFLNLTILTDLADPQPVLLSDAVQLELNTARARHFERAFLPPTAIALVKIVSSGEPPADTVLLDGGESDHPDPEARLVRWTWVVHNTVTLVDTPYTGRVIRAYGYDCSADNDPREITLTVTDNFGLFATGVIASFVC